MKKNKNYIIDQLVSTDILTDFFSMHLTQVSRHLKSGLRLDNIYIVLNRPDLTTKEKRDYVFRCSMSFSMKENIWNRFQGDYGYAYCKQKSNSLEFRV
jgi:hypothetical protein